MTNGEGYFLRQLGILNPRNFRHISLQIVGVGGIGSVVAIEMAKMLQWNQIIVYDPDKVEEHNISNQIYSREDIGRAKVDAIREILLEYAVGVSPENVIGKCGRFEDEKDNVGSSPQIIIVGVDTMESRKRIWERVKYKPNVEGYIEGRMSPSVLRLYTIRNCCDPNIIRRYEETLYTDEEALDLPCTAQAVIDAPFIMAGLIGIQVRKILMREPLPMEIIFDLKNLRIDTISNT
ncbi:MAG: ThiF family adenylyltransferase [Candidatus Aenigmatarchaeota archaeon]